MIIFPADCYPDYVVPVSLPKAPTRTLTPLAAYRTAAIRLTDVDTGGVMAFHFNNHSTLPGTTGKWGFHGSDFDKPTKTIIAGCDYKEYGYTELWRWCSEEIRWEQRPFQIPLTHRMWRMTRLKDMWHRLSNGGATSPGLWRYVSLTKPNDGSLGTRDISSFVLTLRHEITGDDLVL